MGCSSSKSLEEKDAVDENMNIKIQMKKLKELVEEMNKGIVEYEKLKAEYESILKLQLEVDSQLDNYFELRKEKNLMKETEPISIYPQIYHKIRKLEERLLLNPNKINLK